MAVNSQGVDAKVISSAAQVGGGSLPLVDFPSFAVSLRPADGKVEALAERLRMGEPAVLGRLQQDRLLLDVRTLVDDEQVSGLADALIRSIPPAGV